MFHRIASWQTLKNPRFFISLLLGMGFGVFVYSYWLVDYLPPFSNRIFIFTGLAVLVGVVGYFMFLEEWLMPRISEMDNHLRWLFVGLSILGGIFLMVVGTDAWGKTRYVVFLLPSQTIDVSVPPKPNQSATGVSILLVSTSTGNVSFDTINFRGWKRVGDTLVLQDWSNNLLHWKGNTGEKALIVFRTSLKNVKVDVSFGGDKEEILLVPGKDGKFIYGHKFNAPLYASYYMVLALSILNFTALAAAIISLIWCKRKILVPKITESLKFQSDKKTTNLDLGLVAVIVVATVLLRIFNLEMLPPYIDEYSHLSTAKDIVMGSPISSVYQRSLWIVTLPVAFAFQTLGIKLWVARLVGILFNALAVIPLYLITKKINRPVAVISCILYATSPWIIAVARNVREYAYYPFYFYWIVFGLIVVIERFPDQFSLRRDFRRLLEPQIIFPSLILLFPLYYGFVLDASSTFKVIIGVYAVFCLFILMKMDFRRINRVLIVVVAMIVAGAIFVLIYFHLLVTATPLRMFFTNPIQQWYYDRTMIPVALALGCAILISIYFYRYNFIPLFILTIFLGQLAFFVFFFERYFRPRYISNVQYWYVMVLAIGVHIVWLFLQTLLQKRTAFLIAGMLIIFTFNPSQISLPSINAQAMPMPITGEYHGDVKKTNDFLLDKVKEEDVLISTYYANYIHFAGKPTFSKIFPYIYYTQSKDYIMSIVGQYNSGWIVIDDTTGIAFSKLPTKTFQSGSKKIEYLGNFGNQYVWRWYIGSP